MAASGSALDRLGVIGKVILSAVILAVVGAAYYVVWFTDTDTSISAEKSRQQTLQGQLSTAEDAKAAYQKDLDRQTALEKQLQEQTKVAPDDAEMPSFLASIQNVATSSGVSLTSYTPQDEQPGPFYAKVPMALTVSGKFHQVVRFFHGIGELPRVINIEDIEMSVDRKTESADDVIVNVKCLATAFRMPKQGEAANPKGRQR